MRRHPLFTRDVLASLCANGQAALRERGPIRPVCKIFNPFGAAMWLLSETDPSEPDHLYGLCDLGRGMPELGHVSREGLETAYVLHRGYRLPLERDPWFTATHTLAIYTAAARTARMITENSEALDRAAARLADTRPYPAGWMDWPVTGTPTVLH